MATSIGPTQFTTSARVISTTAGIWSTQRLKAKPTITEPISADRSSR